MTDMQAAPAAWSPVAGHLVTRWAAQVDPRAPLPEYPRPQLRRPGWQNLNGLWDYAVLPIAAASAPSAFQGQILVPFPIESALSGVKKPLLPDQCLWYRRSFTAPDLGGRRLLLQFGAVDYEAVIRVNGRRVGEHRGGYDAFSCDITDAVRPGADNELVVAVRDETGPVQPKGKQKLGAIAQKGSIRYTPCSGIWQTVWLETVPQAYIESLRLSPDPDTETLVLVCRARSAGGSGALPAVRVQVLDGGRAVAAGEGAAGGPIRIRVPSPKAWSPESPHLYDLAIEMGEDRVESYFGMRKIALGRDERGILRPLLNGKFVFHAGLLDQGYWPDGLYTAPTDEALRYDLEVTRELGFNMVRKHVKVEPARWYYWADKLGLLVWQDMPSGGAGAGSNKPAGASKWNDGARVSDDANALFERELRAMVEQLGNHPSILVWVVFNEGWGQYEAPRLARWVKSLDPSRLVNTHSGGRDIAEVSGDFNDIHIYPGPECPPAERTRTCALGEFGGYGLPVAGHTWVDEAWGYEGLADAEALTRIYEEAWRKVWQLKEAEGLSAAVYTQTTDVEAECNGLLTYDRAVVKMDPRRVAAAVRCP